MSLRSKRRNARNNVDARRKGQTAIFGGTANMPLTTIAVRSRETNHANPNRESARRTA